MPKVAANLATALIIFLASWLMFPAVRDWLSATPVPDYPISCTAEAAPVSENVRRIEVHVINAAEDDLSSASLRRRLRDALRETGGAGNTEVHLPRERGRVIRAGEDEAFNRGKGRLVVYERNGDLWIRVDRIDRTSVLRAVIDVEMPGSLDVSRGAPISDVPFDLRNIGEVCYTSS